MKKVLFVCLGNICRSPMAEAVFRTQVAEKGLSQALVTESRATSHWNDGQPPHEGTRKKLAEHGIGVEGMSSAQIKGADFAEFDLIIGMDHQNIKDLKAIAPIESQAKIKLFLEILPEHDYQEVPDPYYTGDFDLTYELVEAASTAWLEKLSK